MSKRIKLPPSFPALVQAYFGEYLTQQRALSLQTIAAYRDGFVLFLTFAEERLGQGAVRDVAGRRYAGIDHGLPRSS